MVKAQGNKIKVAEGKLELNQVVTENFLEIAEQIVANRSNGEIHSEGDFGRFLDVERNYLAKIRKEGRSVSIDMLAKMVNKLNVNANMFFLLDQQLKEKENLFRDQTNVSFSGSGKNQSVSHRNSGLVVQADTVSGPVTYNVEKIINSSGLPVKDRKRLLEALSRIEVEKKAMTEEVRALKKTLAEAKKTIDLKDKKYEEINAKYIALLEQVARSKK